MDDRKLRLTENETALLREIAHGMKLPGYPEIMLSRGRALLTELAAHFDAKRQGALPPPPEGA